MATAKTTAKKAPDTGRKVKETAKKVQQELLESAHKVWLAGLGVLATAVLELPPFFAVMRGAPLPRGTAYVGDDRRAG